MRALDIKKPKWRVKIIMETYPGKITRGIYIIAITLIAFTLLQFAIRQPISQLLHIDKPAKLAGIPFSLFTLIAIGFTVYFIILRILNILSGHVTLYTNNATKKNKILGLVGIVCVYLGVAQFTFNIFNFLILRSYTDINFITMLHISIKLTGYIPLGIVLFELSRILNYEAVENV